MRVAGQVPMILRLLYAAATDAATGTTDKPAASDATPAGQTPEQVAAAAKVTAEAATAAAAATAATAAAAAEAAKVPDKYDLKIPAALTSFVDADDLKYVEEVARKAGWTNEDAQAALEEQLATVQAQSARWLEATKADKQYGGEKFDETRKLAERAVNRIRPEGHARRESFMRFLGKGGAGNHPEVLGFLADIGRSMSEDSPQQGGTGGAPAGDVANKLYDHPTSKPA